MMSADQFKKSSFYKFNEFIFGILELNDGTIPCWTPEGIQLLKYSGNNNLELVKTFPLEIRDNANPLLLRNGNVVYGILTDGGDTELKICDANFEILENYVESDEIRSVCNLSEDSFALGLDNGPIKIYSRKSNAEKYEVKSHEYHTERVWSLLYLPKQNFLVSGSQDTTINVLNLSDEKSIAKLTGHSERVFSLISLDDNTFASSSKGEIKIWEIKSDNSIECVKTIVAHEGSSKWVVLNKLGDDFMVSYTTDSDEFKIWDAKTFECVKTYNEDTLFTRMIVTKDKKIVTVTRDSKVSVWQI
jgi:WD40 repeat protein